MTSAMCHTITDRLFTYENKLRLENHNNECNLISIPSLVLAYFIIRKSSADLIPLQNYKHPSDVLVQVCWEKLNLLPIIACMCFYLCLNLDMQKLTKLSKLRMIFNCER